MGSASTTFCRAATPRIALMRWTGVLRRIRASALKRPARRGRRRSRRGGRYAGARGRRPPALALPTLHGPAFRGTAFLPLALDAAGWAFGVLLADAAPVLGWTRVGLLAAAAALLAGRSGGEQARRDLQVAAGEGGEEGLAEFLGVEAPESGDLDVEVAWADDAPSGPEAAAEDPAAGVQVPKTQSGN